MLTAIILALNGFGVWSLVIGYVLKIFIEISIQWYYSGWRPKFEFDRVIARDMFHFGKFILATSIVGFLHGNLDNIIIGKFLGITMLGYYAIARNTSMLLSRYILGKTRFIMYPAYSKIQQDKASIRRILLKTLKYMSMVAFPFSLGLLIFAPDVLRIVFGEKWLPATDILRILALVGVFRSFVLAVRPVFLARGRAKEDFQVEIAQVGIFFILLVPFAIKFKLVGIGLAVLISNIISFCVALVRAKRIIQISFLAIFEAIKPALLCSLLMALAGVFLKSTSFTEALNLNFFIPATASVLVYILATYCMDKKLFANIKEILA